MISEKWWHSLPQTLWGEFIITRWGAIKDAIHVERISPSSARSGHAVIFPIRHVTCSRFVLLKSEFIQFEFSYSVTPINEGSLFIALCWLFCAHDFRRFYFLNTALFCIYYWRFMVDSTYTWGLDCFRSTYCICNFYLLLFLCII